MTTVENEVLRTGKIILVQPSRGVPRNGVTLACWYTTAKALSESGLQYEVASGDEWTQVLGHAEENFVFFTDVKLSKAVLEKSREFSITGYLFLSPTSFDETNSEPWVAELREPRLNDLEIITDSLLSRDIIEQKLNNTRRIVRVLYPDFSLLYGGLRGCKLESLVEVAVRLQIPRVDCNDAFAAYKQNVKHVTTDQVFQDEWKTFSSVEIPPIAELPPFEELREKVDAFLETWSLEERHVLENRNLVSELVALPKRELEINVGVLGTKLTFIDELARALQKSTGAQVFTDEWKYLSGPSNVERSEQILEKSDVVIGEWARPNNFWIQARAKETQRLIVRAHRYEITTDFPNHIDMQKYFAGVVIVPWVGRKLVQDYGWPSEKMVYIPNFVDKKAFSREKANDARFTLGMVGITPSLKRLDLALNLLSALRENDARYNLRVRGALPTAHINWGTDHRIVEQWERIQLRLKFDERLRGAVHFDSPGRDMAQWYEQIGVILSLSDIEGSHVALAEGIASGAIPVARRWPGIETLWPDEFVFDDFVDAVHWVRRVEDRNWYHETSKRLQQLPSLDSDLVLRAWTALLDGDIQSAQQCFGPVDWHAPYFERVAQ